MSNRARYFLFGAGMAIALALLPAGGTAQERPAAAPAPASPGSVRVVFGPTGRPAAGLRVTIDGRGSNYEAVTGQDGVAQINLDGTRLRVTDPQSGLLLLATLSPDFRNDIIVPLPLRITGTATGFGTSPRLRVGSGRQIVRFPAPRADAVRVGPRRRS